MSAHDISTSGHVDSARLCDEFPSDDEVGPRYSAEDLSAYYYELECLLTRIEKAETHYEVLGIDYLATTDETITAYLKAMIRLDPAAYGLDLAPTEALGPRVASASERVSDAYQTLMNFDQRLEYDGQLFGWEAENPKRRKPSPQRRRSSAQGTNNEQGKANRRERDRFDVCIPVEVTGYNENAGDWHEVGQSIDLSRSGGRILLTRRVLVGNILFLRMPMPTVLRQHEYIDQTYGTYAIVRWIRPPLDGFRLVGIQFIGELPPPGFDQRPWDRFHVSSRSGVNRRAEPRDGVSEAIEIEYFNESEQLIKKDSGFIEDISTSGARVCARQPPLEADLIRITRPKLSISLFAQVRNRFKGRDGYERLCSQFINGSPVDDPQDY